MNKNLTESDQSPHACVSAKEDFSFEIVRRSAGLIEKKLINDKEGTSFTNRKTDSANIFKILSAGDWAIKEPQLNAFVAYTLDERKNIGARQLIERIFGPWLQDSDAFRPFFIGSRLKAVTTTEVTVEKKVYDKQSILGQRKRKRSDIDIVIKFRETSLKLDGYICIETKLDDSCIRAGQLYNQSERMKGDLSDPSRVCSLFITKQKSHRAKSEFNLLEGSLNQHLTWRELAAAYLVALPYTACTSKLVTAIGDFIEYIESYFNDDTKKLDHRQRGPYLRRHVMEAVFNEIHQSMSAEEIMTVAQLSEKLCDMVAAREEGKEPVTPMTQCQKYIVNEPKRVNSGVHRGNALRYDRFYYVYPNEKYTDKDRLIRKLDQRNPPSGIKRYYRE